VRTLVSHWCFRASFCWGSVVWPSASSRHRELFSGGLVSMRLLGAVMAHVKKILQSPLRQNYGFHWFNKSLCLSLYAPFMRVYGACQVTSFKGAFLGIYKIIALSMRDRL